jgi:hypothetical protein
MKNIRSEARRHFVNKKREYQKRKNELPKNSKKKEHYGPV